LANDRGIDFVRAKSAVQVIAATLWLSACLAPPPPINSVAFARRAPLPGQPGYLETIGYIDDGVRYIDPSAEFFVSPDGEMCFRGLVNRQQAEFETYTNYWCISPFAVSDVDALENNVSYVNEVRLWCGHADPQCAHRVGFADYLDTSPGIANSILVQVTPYKPERAAVEHLVYLMGGNVRDTWTLR
jgi:hypothetical protein